MSDERDDEMEVVASTTDPALLPVLQSVLDAAGIPYVVHGAAGVQLFPLGSSASRVTRRMLGTTILVPRERAEEARTLLETPPEPLEDLPE